MSERGLTWCFLAALAVAGGVAWWEWPAVSSPSTVRAAPPERARATPTFLLAGTPSCSAHACHGGTEPAAGQELQRNEYTKWLIHDRHADAFRVLLTERSLRIAGNLNLPRPPSQETLCLACHTNPLTASVAAEEILQRQPDSAEAALIRADRFAGVGCESCHGSAGKWLQPHTRPGWTRELEAKLAEDPSADDFGFRPMRDFQLQIQTCVGCHIGAPEDKKLGVPPRDVNHDLIAAGHPRMDFELGAFLANSPPHWNEETWKKRQPQDAEVAIWLTGQLLSEETALELLAFRADATQKRPWPELAEYDCFVCHHSLKGDKNWRQKAGYPPQRQLGALPWSMWYHAMPRAVANSPLTANTAFVGKLDGLAKSMGKTVPNREEVCSEALATAAMLKEWRQKQADEKHSPQMLRSLLSRLASNYYKDADLSPQAAEQLYQAAVILSLAQKDRDFFSKNRQLSEQRRNTDGFDAPIQFSPNEFRDELLKYLKER